MFWNNVFLLAVVFVLTYDPRSRVIEKFIGQPTKVGQKPKTATSPTNRNCENTHYNSIQFGQEPYECPVSNRVQMGAIYSTA